jgi:hypothetical protein
MVPETLDMLILKTLERNREPMHGYGIAQYLRQTTRDVFVSRKDRSLRRYNALRSKGRSNRSGVNPRTTVAPDSTS